MESLEKQVKIFMLQSKLLCCILCMIFLTGTGSRAGGHKIMSVRIKKGQVRAAPSFIGKILGNLSYGDQVSAFEEKGGWIKIYLPNRDIKGWIHKTALSSKKIKLRAGATNVKQFASSDEVALAGKGFNKQVEGAFKAKNPNMNFTWIDKMERINISAYEISNFIQTGDLVPKGGF